VLFLNLIDVLALVFRSLQLQRVASASLFAWRVTVYLQTHGLMITTVVMLFYRLEC
jgi:hypothetical protein